MYPGVEEVNAADLEYRELSRYIRKALVSNGLIEANDPESAELAIFVNYGIGEPKTTYYSYSMPVLGTTGGRIVHDFSGPFKPSTPGRLAVVGSRNVTGSRTTYYRYLILEAFDAQRLREGGEAVQITHHGGFTSFEAWDGQSLFFSKNAQPGIWQLDYDSGAITRLTDALAIPDYNSWTVTQDALYYLKREEHAPTMLVRYDLAVGEATPVMPVPRNLSYGGRGLGLTVSPDEQWLVYGRVDERSSDLMMVETQ
ncbi:MAG: hypothetical protein IH820_03330 [Bacteroidetes bacterium]|nr:hypothetical protein [Bacteroidota bacterium]